MLSLWTDSGQYTPYSFIGKRTLGLFKDAASISCICEQIIGPWFAEHKLEILTAHHVLLCGNDSENPIDKADDRPNEQYTMDM